MSNHVTGIVSVVEAYSKAALMQRLGISQKFWDKMLDDGLPYTLVGHTRWVSGRDLVRHLQKHSQRKEVGAQ